MEKIEGTNYNVSTHGDVVNRTTGKKLSVHKRGSNKGDYPYVSVSINKVMKHKSVHRLVAEVFLINKELKSDVNHKDKNRNNYHVSNLEWCTRAENEKHKRS